MNTFDNLDESQILSLIPTEGALGSDFYKQSSYEALVVFISALKKARHTHRVSDLAIMLNSVKAIEELADKLKTDAPNSTETRTLTLFLDRYRVPHGMLNMKDRLGGLAEHMSLLAFRHGFCTL